MLALKPKRQDSADLGKQLAQATARLDTARAQVAAGETARVKYATNYSAVARLGKAVPTDDDVPSLVYQLDSTAKDTGVDFRSVKLTSGSGGGPAPANAAQAAAATQDNAQNNAASQDGKDAGANASKDSGAQPPANPAPAAPTQAATAGLPPGASVGPAGLSTMPFTFSFEGSFFKLSDFLTRLERYVKATRRSVGVRGRLLLVDGISLTAASGGFPSMKAAIAAQAYLLPAEQGLYNGASPQGPTAMTPAPSVSDNGGGSPVPAATVTP
jgi:hypothetical protein